MSNQKTVYLRNPGRNIPDKIKPYTPQYVEEGIEPTPYPANQGGVFHVKATKIPPQPATVGQFRRGVPNVGSIDSFDEMKEVVVPDLSHLDPNHPMIDNNDHYSVEAFETPADDVDWERSVPRFQPKQEKYLGTDRTFQIHEKNFQSSDEDFEKSSRMVREGSLQLKNDEVDPISVLKNYAEEMEFHPLAILKDLDPDQYLLFVSGVPICSAPLKEIEQEVNDLLFGRHELCKHQEVDEGDILVVKKVALKIGVFLEE